MSEDRDLTDEESIALLKFTGKNRQRSNRFEVSEGRQGLWIDDDEFSYDAAIRITGDFETPEAKRAYLQAVCDVLNAQEDRIPWRRDADTEVAP
jgi:hypothetical protein